MRFSITGGTKLSGTVKASGAKNSVLKLMALSLMGSETSLIRNVPTISDVYTMKGVIEAIGARVRWLGDTMEIDPPTRPMADPPSELVKEMRASIQVMGPLLTRWGRVNMALPGGCDIGPRPIDFHLKGFREMGAEIEEAHGYVMAKSNGLRGTSIYLDFPSVGATENIMAAAVLAQGRTIISNAAREPEVVDEQNFLNMMGARIRGAGTDRVIIDGVRELSRADYRVIPDRVEAGTMLIAGIMTGGHVTVQDVIPEHLESLISKLREMGACVEVSHDQIEGWADGPLKPVHVRSMPYPGFPTDLQPHLAALAAIAEGTSVLVEHIYSNRFHYLDEMRKMGASVVVEQSTAVIHGVRELTSAQVTAPDLRGGAALVLCGMVADGTTIVNNVSPIDRGYESLEKKLTGLGARIARIG